MVDSNRRHEIVEVIIYYLSLLILGYWLKDLFSESWTFGFLKIFLPFNIMSYFIAMSFGIYFGILGATMLKDTFKRFQAVSLFTVSIYVAYYYINHIYNNFFLFTVFFVGALYYASKQELPSCRYARSKNRPLVVLAFLTSFFLVISLSNYLVGYYSNFYKLPSSTMNHLLLRFDR